MSAYSFLYLLPLHNYFAFIYRYSAQVSSCNGKRKATSVYTGREVSVHPPTYRFASALESATAKCADGSSVTGKPRVWINPLTEAQQLP
jgi:hypothetical protein